MEDPRVDDEVDEREHQHDAPGGAVRDDDGKRQYAADRDHVPRAGEGQDQAEEGDGSYHSTNLSVEITASNVGSSGSRGESWMIESWRMWRRRGGVGESNYLANVPVNRF